MRTKRSQKNQSQENNTINLHEVRHAEVQRTLDQFLHDHIRKGTNTVHIITGNSDKMKEVVEDVLADYELHGEQDEFNSGQLNVNIYA